MTETWFERPRRIYLRKSAHYARGFAAEMQKTTDKRVQLWAKSCRKLNGVTTDKTDLCVFQYFC